MTPYIREKSGTKKEPKSILISASWALGYPMTHDVVFSSGKAGQGGAGTFEVPTPILVFVTRDPTPQYPTS